MVRVQTGLVLAGMLILATKLHADPALAGAASGSTVLDKDKPTDTNAMTTPELETRVAKLSTVLDEDMQHAQIAQSRAKKSKDILKLNCVNDGLLVTKQVVNIGELAKAKFDKAVQANDRNEQILQYQNLASAVGQCDDSKQSIDGCVGSSQVTVTGPDGSKVSVISPNVRDNPTNDCDNLGRFNCMSQPLEYVGYASPFTPN